MNARPHWSDRLVSALPTGPTTVSIDVDASRDHAAVVTLLTRLPAVLDALRGQQTERGDALDNEDPEDLLSLLEQLHQVLLVVEGQEERVLQVCRRLNIPLRSLAAALDLRSPESVRKRLRRSDMAEPVKITDIARDGYEPIADKVHDAVQDRLKDQDTNK